MVRFGKYCIKDKNLSFFGKISYFIHGNPHIAKFIQSMWFRSKIKSIISNKIIHVLDVGCGNGDYAFYLAEKYPWLKIEGIDSNSQNILCANEIKKKNNLLQVNFSNKSLEEFSSKNKYDVIYCVEVLHAVDNKEEFINRICALLKQNGLFYFQDCFKGSFEEKIICEPAAFREYQKHNFRDLQLPESELVNIIKKAGLEIINKSNFFGFFGRFAWEIDQKLHTVRIKYIRTLLIPLLKFFCVLDSLILVGKMEELAIVAKK